MMTYKIISTRQADETLFTTVEFDFDGTVIIIEIAHYMPESAEVIVANILNAASSIQIKMAATELIQTLIPTLPIGQTNEL